MEYTDEERFIFDEVMEILKKHPKFQKYEMQNESKWSLPGLEIYLSRRKIYCDGKEVHLTAKEYELFCLLVANRGLVPFPMPRMKYVVSGK